MGLGYPYCLSTKRLQYKSGSKSFFDRGTGRSAVKASSKRNA
jgi:hypothetical protein